MLGRLCPDGPGGRDCACCGQPAGKQRKQARRRRMTFCAGVHLISARCVRCNASRLAKMTPDAVGWWYRRGYYSQDEFEAYMHVWATSAVRHSAGEWLTVPQGAAVVEMVAAIRLAAGLV